MGNPRDPHDHDLDFDIDAEAEAGDDLAFGRTASRLRLTADADADGARLDKWLADAVPPEYALSRSRLKALIEAGQVTLGGVAALSPNTKVIAGTVCEIALPEVESAQPSPENIPLDVLFEDKHLIVIDKPPGMVVHPAPGQRSGTLVNALLHHCGASLGAGPRGFSGIGGVARPGIVHRLDKDTSGVMVAAKTQAAHAGLTELFQAHDIERAYLAVTRGAPRPLAGRIETRIARSPHDRKKMAVVRERRFKADPYSDDPESDGEDAQHGKIAITNYQVLQPFGLMAERTGEAAAALVECRLETGRTHQIRVHLGHIGAPVLGDPVYGKGRGLKAVGSGPRHEAAIEAAREFPRQALHAAVLGFEHPVTKKPLRFEASPPADMAALIAALRGL